MDPLIFPPALRKSREVAGMTQRQLADRIGMSSSALCRWEKGESSPRRDHVELLEKALGVRGDLLRAWSSQTSGTTLPPWMQDAARLEEEATVIEYISPVLVPGMLQCQQYAELVFRYGQPLETPAEISRLAAARSSRYEHLRQHRDPWVTAVFPVQALTAVPEQVRRAQSAHLAALVGAGRVSIHLVPEGTVLVGITSPILMVRLADGGRAGSSDHISGNVLLDDQVDWARLDELSKRAFGLALPADQSLTLLGDLAK